MWMYTWSKWMHQKILDVLFQAIAQINRFARYENKYIHVFNICLFIKIKYSNANIHVEIQMINYDIVLYICRTRLKRQ